MEGAAKSAISRGAIDIIVNAPKNPAETFPNPVLQCLQIRPMNTAAQAGTPDRYRIVLSDIDHYAQGMLATQANHVIESGQLKKNSIIRLKGFNTNQVKQKRIMIVLDLEVLEEYWPIDKIGEPDQVETRISDDSRPTDTSISTNGFYGTTGQPQQQAQAQGQQPASRSNPSVPNPGHPNIYPIEALNPFAHKWAIKARCTHKSDIKRWNNTKGEGKLFSVNLLDESGEIRATGFNDQCDALYDLFQDGGVYYISSPCRVQLAKKQFSNLSNDYELTFEAGTQVEKAEDTGNDVPQVKFNFTPIGDLQSVEKDTTIDTIGILKEVGEVNQIVSKTTSKPYDKRELTLVDNSGYSVRLTIWGKSATTFDTMEDAVVAFKGVKVSDFGGRSLSLLSSGSMTVDPDIDDAHKLKGWYDASGRNDNFLTHNAVGTMGAAGGRSDPVKTIGEVEEQGIGSSEDTAYFATKATIIYVKQENVSYPSCLSTGCNKKVIQEDGGWRCERCNMLHEKPEYRYIMSINVSDHTGQLWLSCFDDVGRLVMGMSADELHDLQESDSEAAKEKFQEVNCSTWLFKCRAKMDTYQDVQRVRYTVNSASAVNFALEGKKLMEIIKMYD